MNNNNSSGATSIGFNARLLQEMVAMRSKVSQQGVQLNVLNDGFRQQFMSPLEDAGSNLATRIILDPLYRSQGQSFSCGEVQGNAVDNAVANADANPNVS
ncbi:uncharacterized protein ATC70_005566 [Mucor velutinosus]|uniref:Uncharacterized protein n=1 Tax=Mucor velutinosus TaxID=708070 RepID=A0AAN7HZH6_9FUNG|nr:hypothetical protein ATC70_005566 [Mucor velutinosus]